MSEYLTIREAFKVMKVDEWTLRGLIKKGKIESTRIHRNNWPAEQRSGKPLEIMAIKKIDLERYLASQKQGICETCDGSGLARIGEGGCTAC